MPNYSRVLSSIHDEGFSWYAQSAAPHILKHFANHGIQNGLVVDLGCGPGRWAKALLDAGYDVFGIDQSREMIRLAKRNAPGARFQVGSLYQAVLPPCDAITSMGEVLNYCFAGKPSHTHLRRLFTRAYRALRKGGVLIVDFATPQRVPIGDPRLYWKEGPRWSILTRTTGDAAKLALKRENIVFVKDGRHYRRNVEIHILRLFEPAAVVAEMTHCGFKAELLESFGDYPLPAGMAVALAVRP